SGDDVGVPVEELGRRMHDDVRAQAQRVDGVGGAEVVFHDQLGAGVVRESGQCREVRQLQLGVGQGFGVDDGGCGGDRSGPGVEVGGVDHDDVEPERGQVTHEQIAGVAVDLTCCDDPAATLQQG